VNLSGSMSILGVVILSFVLSMTLFVETPEMYKGVPQDPKVLY